ncbi:MAG: sigma-70 family RNA polymerase sigma factor [Gammaproteobacteria bacterium]|jgi:RNA polymerase sigma-70 factor (ECF subfamily)|nr:sigma-70 family RNA polymerase sigma factor [Gammaproteobacteria bacterium]
MKPTLPIAELAGDNWSGQDDLQLLTHIAQGSKAAMTEFISRYYQRITDFAWRHMGRKADAEDIAQETFIRVWRKARDWQDRQLPPHSWLYRITYNLCIDELRKRKPQTDVDEHFDLSGNDSPESNLYQLQKDKLLATAFATLSETQRTAIALCNYQGLSNKEAAHVMDVSVEALESLLARGRAKLRKQLSAEP